MRVYVVDTGIQGSHVDFGGRVVNGHTVRAAPVAACKGSSRPCYPRLPAHPAAPTPSLVLPSSQSREHNECASCQAVNGILPADGVGCDGHGTHVASTVGGLDYGVAKQVTLVPAFSCFKVLRCSNGRYECARTSDIRANLEYVFPPATTGPLPRRQPTVCRPYPSRPCSHR